MMKKSFLRILKGNKLAVKQPSEESTLELFTKRISRCVMLSVAIFLFSVMAGSLAAQTVSIVDADPNGGVRFTTSVNAVSLPIYLELDQGRVAGLHVDVDNFVGPDGSLVPVTVTLNGAPPSKSIDITQQDRPQVQISATLSVSGSYKSHISLFYSDRRQKSVPITVTRQRNAVPIQIEGLNTVAITRWFIPPRMTADFVIRETSGQATTLYLPTLVGFALKEGDKKKQAVYNSIRFTVTDDTRGIHIGGQESVPGKLIVTGIRGTGEYSAKIRVSSADTNPVDADLTILVKDNFLVAFFFILTGVGTSYVLRRYTKESRPKLLALRNLDDIRRTLVNLESNAGELGENEKYVFHGLRDRITEMNRELTRGATSDTGAALKDLQNKLTFLPPWLTLGRKLRTVNPPSLIATPEAKWEAFADTYFLKKDAGAAPLDNLAAIGAEIDKVVIDDLLKHIAAFRKTAEDHKTSQPNSAAGIDAGVLPLLVEAEAHVTNRKLPEATTSFQAARRSYGRILAEQLVAELGGQAPPGFKEAEWRALGQQLSDKLKKVLDQSDPEGALSEFEAANRDYVGGLIGAMRTAIDNSKSQVASGIVNPEAQKTLTAKLDDATKALNNGEITLRAGQADTARQSYQQAADAMREASTQITNAGGAQMGFSLSSVVPSFLTMPAGAGVRETASVPITQLPTHSVSDKLTLLIDEYDLWFNLVILLIATAVGLNVLWASDPIWGGWKAYILALLWGLGLQQAGGATLDGLSAVTKKFTE